MNASPETITATSVPETPQPPDDAAAAAASRARQFVAAAWLPVLLAAVAALVYLNSVRNGFALDDVFIVQQNERVHDLHAWRDIWLTPYWPFFGRELGLYRPLAIFLYAVQWAAAGGAPWVFHALNVLLHAAVTVLLFLLLIRLTGRTPALVGALIFAVHPVHAEAVANIVGQAELVVALATLAACLVHATRPPGVAVGWGRRLALLACFTVAVLAKESAVVLIGLLVLIDLLQRRVTLSPRGIASYADALAMPVFLLLAAFAFYMVFRYEALGGALLGVDAGPQLPFLREQHRVLNALRAIPEDVRLLFFPAALSADYSPAVILAVESFTPMIGLGLGLLLALAMLAATTPWAPRAGFPAAWFLACMLPTSNLLFPIGVLVAERTLYLPSVAVSALAAFAWQAWYPRLAGWRRRLLITALAALVVAGALRTWVRNPDWRSTATLLGSLVRDRPESYRAQWTLASSYQRQGDARRAYFHYDVGYRFYNRDSQFTAEYGNFWLGEQRFARAVDLLERAHRMHPYVVRTSVLLAFAYLGVGDFRRSLQLIELGEAQGADLQLTMRMRAYAYEGLGQPQQAVAAWRVALAQPGYRSWRSWTLLARALALAGLEDQAGPALAHARAAANSPADSVLIDRMADAVRQGCFRHPVPWPRPDGAVAAALRKTPCEPLGDWLRDVMLQTAKSVQDASAE